MTSLASNTIPPTQTRTSPASTSNTPSVPLASPSTSGQSTTIAAATAGSQATPSLVSHTKKPSFTPPIVSSTVGQSPSIVSGVQGTNVHTTNASPVNGKTQVSPAVPTVTPAMSTMSNLIVNGTSGSSNSHGRKPSLVSGGSGGGTWLQNGSPYITRQQHNPGQIQFGLMPPGGPISSPNLAAPAVSNPRVASPQMSPAVPQPAVSGGKIPQAARDPSITFGEQRLHNRPPMPPTVSAAQAQGHIRRESASSHQQHPEISQPGMGPNRGGMPHNGNRRSQAPSYGGQNNFSQQGFGGNHTGYSNRNPPNQTRGAYAGAINPHYQTVQPQMPYSPQRAPRSPVPPHAVPPSLPQTPQIGTIQMASPGPFPTNNYPGVQHLHTQQQFEHNMFVQGYPPMFQQQYSAPPPASPRNQFAALGAPSYMNYNHAMSRSSSTANTEIHRPPSTYPMSHQSISPPAPVTPNDPNLFQKPEKTSRAFQIIDPDTKAPRSFQKHPDTPRSRPAVVASPIIVSSGSPTPRPGATEASRKTDEEKRREMAFQVQKKKEEDEAKEREKKAEAERLKKEAEEAEKRKKEEEEKKHREEEEERLRKEAEEKSRLEEEERIRKEEETRIAKEKAEQEARIEKEKEEQARRIREELEEAERKAKAEAEAEAERIAKEEELRVKEEEEQRAKEEADRLANEEEERRTREAEAKAVAEAEAATAAVVSPVAISAEEAQKGSENPGVIKPADAEDSLEQPMPGKQIATSLQSEDTTRPAVKARAGKPTPLVIKPSNESGPPSAALSALRSARPILNINHVKYPDNIMSPNPALNASAPAGKFKYPKEFLLQFQNVFTEKPSEDWDQRIRDTVGESTDSSRPSTANAKFAPALGPRGSHPRPTSAQPPMGSMGSMGSFGTGKFNLPPNMMTSAQRFEQSSNPNRPSGVMPSNPLATVGQFRPAPPAISRTNSSQGLSQQTNALPQSPHSRPHARPPRTSSNKRGPVTPGGVAMEKSESKQAEPKPMLTTALTDFKPLVTSESRWKPRSVQNVEKVGPVVGAFASASPPVPTEDNLLPPDMVQRKVKAALNKMTPEKFEKISGQILDIANQSRYETDGRTLQQVIRITFEKATDEAAWSSMYAKFCKVMMESIDPSIKDESIIDPKTGNVVVGSTLFRKYLLNRCQEEFQRGWKVNLPPKPEGVTDEAAMLSDEYYIAAAAKRRGLGLIQFIGELFKLSMLTERIMHECVKKLVDYEGIPEEAEVESLCKLLRTIGAALDSTAKSRPAMEAYFARIKQMIEHPDIASRLKFMLMDIVDLRSKNWETDELLKGPKKLAEIQADVAKAAAEKEAASRANAQRGGRPVGRGDGRNFSQGGYGGQSEYPRQNTQNTIATDELRKLKPRDKNANTTQTFGLGPPSMFANRGSNPKKMGSPSFGRGDDSGPASRTATPPSGAQREATRNSFHVLRDIESQVNDEEANDSISPAPSVASSPPLANASPAMRPLVGESDSK